MGRDKIVEMLKELVNEVDYDIYKEMFVYCDASYERLIEIVQRYCT